MGDHWFSLSGEFVNVRELGAVPNDPSPGRRQTNRLAIRDAITQSVKAGAPTYFPKGAYFVDMAPDANDFVSYTFSLELGHPVSHRFRHVAVRTSLCL